MNAKRMLARAVFLLCSGAPLASAGCFEYQYKDLVDPCYPDRYNYMSMMEVREALGAQQLHAHQLEQTVWGYFFEPGTDKLTSLGVYKLALIARQCPQPDTLLFLQTAQITPGETQPRDLVYDPANPDAMITARQDLDARRIAAVQKFMTAQTSGHYAFQIAVVDPSTEVGRPALPIGLAIQQMFSAGRGVLGSGGGVGGGGGTTVSGGGGATSGVGPGGGSSSTGGTPH
jgi:uncharacterized membrane protein YgcG